MAMHDAWHPSPICNREKGNIAERARIEPYKVVRPCRNDRIELAVVLNPSLRPQCNMQDL